jgi:pyruvate dehydrogenase E2 component (dihydrolipoamide acetyltransferase)
MAHYVVRPLTRLQTLVARNMCRAQQETAHATLHTTCDVTLLHEAFAARRTGAASLTSHVLHACTRALQEHPALNAHLVDDELCIYHEIKLGLMLEAGDAVMVGCIPDAAGKTPHALEVALADLHARAASHQLLVEETRGATFMVADLSALPVDTFTPILLPTAIAILGIGRVRAACRPAASWAASSATSKLPRPLLLPPSNLLPILFAPVDPISTRQRCNLAPQTPEHIWRTRLI